MELRYVCTGDHFIPEYKSSGDIPEWKRFKEADIVGYLRGLCESLGDMQLPRRWERGQWYYANSQEVFFTNKILCMAFLGAAKAHFDHEAYSFKL